MSSKLCSADHVVDQLHSGMTIGIGGWASRRKPMAIVEAIVRSDLRDLTIVSYAGADLGMLCAAGKVAQAVYAFASLDTIPLEPHFRRARENGEIVDVPHDEGTMLLGLQAAAWRVPYLPTRAGLGSDLLNLNPTFKVVTNPWDPADNLVAVPALPLDAAICHLDIADVSGNAAFLGPDLFFDDLMLRAASGNRFISVDEVVPTQQLEQRAGTELRVAISRMMVDGVVHEPNGARFTETALHPRDEAAQREYADAAASPDAWAAYRAKWIDQVQEPSSDRTDQRGAPTPHDSPMSAQQRSLTSTSETARSSRTPSARCRASAASSPERPANPT